MHASRAGVEQCRYARKNAEESNKTHSRIKRILITQCECDNLCDDVVTAPSLKIPINRDSAVLSLVLCNQKLRLRLCL